MAPDIPAAPPHLSTEARAWWAKFVAGWSLDDAALLVLGVALEAFDRMKAAQRAIKRDGLTVKGRAHPATVIERDARLALLRAIRSLNLDVEATRDRPGRPPR